MQGSLETLLSSIAACRAIWAGLGSSMACWPRSLVMMLVTSSTSASVGTILKWRQASKQKPYVSILCTCIMNIMPNCCSLTLGCCIAGACHRFLCAVGYLIFLLVFTFDVQMTFLPFFFLLALTSTLYLVFLLSFLSVAFFLAGFFMSTVLYLRAPFFLNLTV